MLKQGFVLIKELQEMVVRINKTNLHAKTEVGLSITEAMAKRDQMSRQHKFLIYMISQASSDNDYYSNREIRWNRTVDVAGLQKQADDIAKKMRELNAAIQQTNWNADLIE